MLSLLSKFKAIVMPSVIEQAATFIIKEEGFLSAPRWDYKQWTWGYGTAAGFDQSKKPVGTITKTKAREDLISFIKNSHKNINSLLRVPIKRNQMVALLSFDFNLGLGNTKNIIARINAGFPASEVAQAMNLYINAGGQRDAGLVARRKRESNLYLA